MVVDIVFDAGDEIQGALIWGVVEPADARDLAHFQEMLVGEERSPWQDGKVTYIWARIEEGSDMFETSHTPKQGFSPCTQVQLWS